ncbi:MAG: histidinol dehydrogenase [Rickettsiales bacterium]
MTAFLVKASREVRQGPYGEVAIAPKRVALDTKTATAVAEIVDAVHARGDAALVEYTNRFDARNVERASELRVEKDAIARAFAELDVRTKEALRFACERVLSYHRNTGPQDMFFVDQEGVELGNMWRRVDSAGLYVPGGSASYPSSVIMNAMPARAAGVERLVMCSPAPEGKLNQAVLAAAHMCGIDEIYSVGGAQAIAAMAFGTETVPKTATVVGPGNKYVAEAKRRLFGVVGVDMVAGPSEILVIAEEGANPAWTAADLLSQAEHDVDAKCYLICFSREFAEKTIGEVERILETLPRRRIALPSWQDHGAVMVAKSREEAAEIANRIAAEHVELLCDDPDAYLPLLRHAGAIFAGHYTPEAIGDYIAGPSHVLPTDGTAAFSSGLSVYNFLKRVSYIRNDAASFARIASSARLLAEKEGLHAHALSVSVRE